MCPWNYYIIYNLLTRITYIYYKKCHMYDKMSYKHTDFLSFFYLIKLSIYHILYIGIDFVFVIANNLNIIYA